MKTALECATEIREYNRWRRGRGRKYAQPGVPFNATALGIILDDAVTHLKHIPDVATLTTLVGMADKFVATLPKGADRTNGRFAIRAMNRYIRKMEKVDEQAH